MTTEQDCETIEVLAGALRRGEIRTKRDWVELCESLNATDAHKFAAVAIGRGGEVTPAEALPDAQEPVVLRIPADTEPPTAWAAVEEACRNAQPGKVIHLVVESSNA